MSNDDAPPPGPPPAAPTRRQPLEKAIIVDWHNWLAAHLRHSAIPATQELLRGVGLFYIAALRSQGLTAEEAAADFATLWALDAETRAGGPKFGPDPPPDSKPS